MTDELKKTQEPAADPAGNEADPINTGPETAQLTWDQTDRLRKAMAAVTGELLKSGAVEKASIKIHDTIKDLPVKEMREAVQALQDGIEEAKAFYTELDELEPYLITELQKPEYNGQTFEKIILQYEHGELIDLRNEPDSFFARAWEAAKAARDKQAAIIKDQQAGRDHRRQLKEAAAEKGAIMELRGGIMPVFSAEDLWNAFAPGRISKIGSLDLGTIDKDTGRVQKHDFSPGEIVPLTAADISYKTFMLLNAIMANSVENYNEFYVSGGSITFYVKGVLDSLEVEPRIRTDEQLNVDRKTAGVLYLERELEPFLMFIGTTDNGSRYSVLNYEGYDADADTMTIRTPYLFELWRTEQRGYSDRKKAVEARRAEGKRPLKKDLVPLRVNFLFKGPVRREDDTVLEIAAYITNVLLSAGKKTNYTETDIKYTTIIKNCPRLAEKLEEIAARPNTELLPDGKKRNNTALYNTELRKIARAYNLIMDPDRCDALNHFEFREFTPSRIRNGKREFIPPTKSGINGKLHIEWRRIDT